MARTMIIRRWGQLVEQHSIPFTYQKSAHDLGGLMLDDMIAAALKAQGRAFSGWSSGDLDKNRVFGESVADAIKLYNSRHRGGRQIALDHITLTMGAAQAAHLREAAAVANDRATRSIGKVLNPNGQLFRPDSLRIFIGSVGVIEDLTRIDQAAIGAALLLPKILNPPL